MKRYSQTFLAFTLVSLTLIASCTKEIEGPIGPEGPQGPPGPAGSGAKTYEVEIVFEGHDIFSGAAISGLNFKSGDAILAYYPHDEISGTIYWSQMPYIKANRVFVPSFSEETGYLFVDLINATTGAFYPFMLNYDTTIKFRVIHVESSWIKQNPEYDLSSKIPIVRKDNIK